MQERFVMFTTLLANINRSIYRIKSEFMSEYDLKSSHVSCLYYLHHGLAKSPSELARVCEEDKANISRALKELEERGFITRLRDSRGRRSGRIAVTDEGREIGEFITKQIDGVLSIVEGPVDDGERSVMYTVLTKISSSLARLADEINP